MAKIYEVCALRGCKKECEAKCISYCSQCIDFEEMEIDMSEYYWLDTQCLQEEFGDEY